jgi:hypothetical protein
MAPPMPCITRKEIRMVAEVANDRRNDEIVKINRPQVIIFFLPYISASRPKGRRKIAEAKIYEVDTQPSNTACICSSWPIEGRAMLMEEPIKVARKKLNEETNKTVPLFAEFFVLIRKGYPFILT